MAATLRRFKRANAMVSAGIGLAGAAFVLALRFTGLLQGAELYAYDTFLRLQPQAPADSDSKIALVEQSETDVETFDYPLPDVELAQLLMAIESQKPAAIGLDLYRNLAEPRDGAHLQSLNTVLTENNNIICTFKFGDASHPFEIPPPDIVKDQLDHIGFNDFPFDHKSIRRAFLFIPDAAGNYYTSFALQLAFLAGVNTQPVPGANLVSIGGAPVYQFSQDTGGYLNAADGGYQFLLDFKGPRAFRSWSMGDVFDGRVPPHEFTGKVVLIGQGAASRLDIVLTPLRDDLPGVEMHALVVDQLLRMQENGARVMRAWGGPAQAGWTLLWCAVAAGIGYHCRAPVLFATAPVVMVLLIFGCCKMAFNAGWWIPLIPPVVGSLPVTAMVGAYMGYREKTDRNTLMGIFSRHVSPAVAEAIWEQRDLITRDRHLIPQCLIATAFFTDLQNFSTIAEGMEPEELLAWINEYMDMLVRHVERYGGMVNKYMGDSIMAVFGAPVPSTSPEAIRRDACNAVKCALAMGDELDRLSARRLTEGRPTTNMRVGIYTGPAVSGSIGSSQRMEFTVLGDAVNTASRLESFDKTLFADQSCRILIGETTRELVERDFHLEFVDTIELKGQHEKTGIYYVPRDKNDEEGRLDRCNGGGNLAANMPGAGSHAGPGPLP